MSVFKISSSNATKALLFFQAIVKPKCIILFWSVLVKQTQNSILTLFQNVVSISFNAKWHLKQHMTFSSLNFGVKTSLNLNAIKSTSWTSSPYKRRRTKWSFRVRIIPISGSAFLSFFPFIDTFYWIWWAFLRNLHRPPHSSVIIDTPVPSFVIIFTFKEAVLLSNNRRDRRSLNLVTCDLFHENRNANDENWIGKNSQFILKEKKVSFT